MGRNLDAEQKRKEKDQELGEAEMQLCINTDKSQYSLT